MAKDPAFLFYPNDWIGGTMGMSFEEKGAYMELLMLQFNRGHMTTYMIGQTVGQLWDKVKDKFVQDEQGLWYNVRLEIEKEKRKTFTESRRNNIKGSNQHTKKDPHIDGHMTSHMENENENVNENLNGKGGMGEKPKVKVIYAHDTPGFIQSFDEWIKYRRQIKKSLTDISMKKQSEFLKSYSPEIAIQILNESMKNGHQGLFPPKNKFNGTHQQAPINNSRRAANEDSLNHLLTGIKNDMERAGSQNYQS